MRERNTKLGSKLPTVHVSKLIRQITRLYVGLAALFGTVKLCGANEQRRELIADESTRILAFQWFFGDHQQNEVRYIHPVLTQC